MKHFLLIIDESTKDIRLDKALSQHPNIESRSQATSLIDRGYVTKGKLKVPPSHKTKVGEEFFVLLPEKSNADLTPYDFQLNIVYEDDCLLVLDKPSGLVVHPAVGHQDQTLVNALIHHFQKLSTGFDSSRPGLVHRIDKDTSGLLVIAKDDTTMRDLALQFKRKTTHRIYYALTYGRFKESSGTIQSYLKRHPTDRKKFASEKVKAGDVPTGKLAITHYKVLSEGDGISYISLQLETGRTHQIRVHLSENSHPIVADPFYCNENRYKSLRSPLLQKKLKNAPRLMLHAAELGFVHPKTKEKMIFKCEWPAAEKEFLKSLELV